MVPLFQVIFNNTDMDNTHKKEQKAEEEEKKSFPKLELRITGKRNMSLFSFR